MSGGRSTPPLVAISRALSRAVSRLTFHEPVAYVYNPLDYARRPHERYLETYGRGTKRVIFLGMNPGPFGMAQTGVPFGEVGLARDYLRVDAPVDEVIDAHPKRPVEGFACKRSEVSGARFWGWVKGRHPDPRTFFERAFVVNYCPLAFVEESGRNLTPDKLPVEERAPLYEACDRALVAIVETLEPAWIVGVGAFGKERAEAALGARSGLRFGAILHPSPANPRANRGWAEAAENELAALDPSILG
ncbi:MAG: single-stranded DNA-binding protein [Sandaracinaceae bacterium]|nr:single-stranded DNA-binding protein [Sandaracinaceae bacterium]